MIRVNLLNSVTERHGGAVASVERRVASPASRLLLMSLAVLFMLLAVTGWDIISTQMAKTDAETRLEEQKRIAAELEAVMKEQKELEAKIQGIDSRIEAIKRLRASQAGPKAVLDALEERIAMVPGLFLESVEQKGDQLEIRGTSNEEGAPTRFGQSLEFSGGLFSNLGIETTRKEEGGATQVGTTTAPTQPAAPTIVSFDFIIRCAYTPSKADPNASSEPTVADNKQPNQPNGASPSNPQPAPQPQKAQ